ncbi:MAG: DUF6155 family protein [Bacteroidia bacterium]
MKKLTKKALLKHLQKSDKEDIIQEIIRLFDRFKNVQEFYKAELSEDENPILEIYKKRITNAYSSAHPSERRTNMNVNKLIRDFKKTTIYADDLTSLLLHRVACGIDAFSRDNKRSETFYKCIVSSFKEAIETINANENWNKYEQYLEQLIEKSASGKFAVSERLQDLYLTIFDRLQK